VAIGLSEGGGNTLKEGEGNVKEFEELKLPLAENPSLPVNVRLES
jgi:hypothetical protein